jgi:hypothetical protein
MKKLHIYLITLVLGLISCSTEETPTGDSIEGFELLNQINGHWVGTNQTAFGFFEWFAFDFRPISPSHSHSIYEGGTNQNIITSIFLADHNGRQQIMARNGGWLGSQYRATYYVLDKEESNGQEKYYRLVDAIGGINRSFIEFKFRDDSIFIDAYKDDSGTLNQPIHHMGFAGRNRNPDYADIAKSTFLYPQQVSEINLNDQFDILIDPDSALFLVEEDDPFPKSDHGYVSELSLNIIRNQETNNRPLLLYISKGELISASANVDFNNVDNAVIRTVDINSSEENYIATYLHPDDYYITVFADLDNNGFPSTGDYSSISIPKSVFPESSSSQDLVITLQVP